MKRFLERLRRRIVRRLFRARDIQDVLPRLVRVNFSVGADWCPQSAELRKIGQLEPAGRCQVDPFAPVTIAAKLLEAQRIVATAPLKVERFRPGSGEYFLVSYGPEGHAFTPLHDFSTYASKAMAGRVLVTLRARLEGEMMRGLEQQRMYLQDRRR